MLVCVVFDCCSPPNFGYFCFSAPRSGIGISFCVSFPDKPSVNPGSAWHGVYTPLTLSKSTWTREPQGQREGERFVFRVKHTRENQRDTDFSPAGKRPLSPHCTQRMASLTVAYGYNLCFVPCSSRNSVCFALSWKQQPRTSSAGPWGEVEIPVSKGRNMISHDVLVVVSTQPEWFDFDGGVTDCLNVSSVLDPVWVTLVIILRAA